MLFLLFASPARIWSNLRRLCSQGGTVREDVNLYSCTLMDVMPFVDDLGCGGVKRVRGVFGEIHHVPP